MINLRFFSKFNQNTVGWFQAILQRVLGVLMTWWCFMNFLWFSGVFFDFQKFTKHHQVTSTSKTLRKLAWNHPTVFWLNFEKNWRFLFFYGSTPNYKLLGKFPNKFCAHFLETLQKSDRKTFRFLKTWSNTSNPLYKTQKGFWPQ